MKSNKQFIDGYFKGLNRQPDKLEMRQANKAYKEYTRGILKGLEQGLTQAICSRGRNKGLLKAKCPPMDTYGAAVWQGLMFYSNAYKMGLGHMLFMSKDKKAVYNYIIEAGKIIDLSTFDSDGNTLRELKLM